MEFLVVHFSIPASYLEPVCLPCLLSIAITFRDPVIDGSFSERGLDCFKSHNLRVYCCLRWRRNYLFQLQSRLEASFLRPWYRQNNFECIEYYYCEFCQHSRAILRILSMLIFIANFVDYLSSFVFFGFKFANCAVKFQTSSIS